MGEVTLHKGNVVVRASDVPTILGLNPFKSAIELWGEYTGRVVREEFDDPLHPTKVGVLMEEPIAELYARATTRIPRRDSRDFTSDEYPWLVGHIDRRVTGMKRGVEIKNVGPRSSFLWGAPGGEIAEHYLPQVLTYLLLTEFDAFDVAAYFGGNDFRVYEVEPDREWFEIIVEATHEFAFNNVIKDIAPPVKVAADYRALARVYTGTTGEVIDAPELENWLSVYDNAVELAKQYGNVADVAKAHLLRTMGDASILRIGDRQLARKVVKRKGYVVEESQYIDARFSKVKGE